MAMREGREFESRRPRHIKFKDLGHFLSPFFSPCFSRPHHYPHHKKGIFQIILCNHSNLILIAICGEMRKEIEKAVPFLTTASLCKNP